MSIMQSTPAKGHSAKRRKLSHSSDEVSSDDENTQNGNESSDEEVQSQPKDTRLTQGPKRTKTSRRQTSSEQNAQNAGVSNRSSILSLQLNDLISEVKPNYDFKLSYVSTALDRLSSVVKSIPDQDGLSLTQAEKLVRETSGIAIPFPQPRPTKDTNLKFAYTSPERLIIRGPLVQQLSVKGRQFVCLAVVMPPVLFQQKDYLNHRAFYKRAFYLAKITVAWKKAVGNLYDFAYKYEDDIELLPVLRLTTKDDSESNKTLHEFDIYVSPVFPSGCFAIDKTTPDRNCVRLSTTTGDAPQSPTPFYNSCIQSQAACIVYDELISDMTSRCSAFADTCRIGQIWLRQQGFSSALSDGGFGQREWSIMCALLLKTGGHLGRPLFSERYNSLQLFKAMLQVLSGKDLSHPLVLNSSTIKLADSPTPVLLDGNTSVNILYKMSSWSYKALRHQAQTSLTAVNSKSDGHFDATFTTRAAEPLLQFDEIYAITIPGILKQTPDGRRKILEDLYQTLQRGLGDRVTLVSLKPSGTNDWSIEKSQPAVKGPSVINICLLINSEATSRLIDHGPSADDQDAAADFRNFWGEKAELRRFKDGSISESLVWSSDKSVTMQVIQYLLLRHFNLPLDSIVLSSTKYEEISLGRSTITEAENAYEMLNTKFQDLSSTLHQLEGLPLPIRSVMPADAVLRSSSTQIPLLEKPAQAIDIVVQFDSSARWPDSLPAIQYTKIAFLVKLGDLLSEKDSSVTTRVGLENTSTASTGYYNTSYLDIIYPSPGSGLSLICFRARIYHDREAHLLQTVLSDKSLPSAVRESVATALAVHKRNYIARPLHTTTIRSLCSKFPPLSPTIRLLKKWTSSHLLLRLISEELHEIMAVTVFLNPAPWSVPGSPTTAFFRCLHLLSRWDWAYQPLIVDLSLSQDMSEASRAEIETRFQAWRKLDPNMNRITWFVGTNIDTSGSVWTQGFSPSSSANVSMAAMPPKVAAARIAALASAAIELIKEKGADMSPPTPQSPPSFVSSTDWENIFISPLTDFDFQIHLKPSIILGSHKTHHHHHGKSNSSETTQFKNLQLQSQFEEDNIERIGYDPISLFLSDLEHAFGSAVLFFYDSVGHGQVIAGLWRPSVLGQKEFRVRLGWSSIPINHGRGRREGKVVRNGKQEEETGGERGRDGDGKDMCVINKEGILAEIVLLGEGIVKNVTTR